jgi:hypothetical protein
MNHMTDSGDAAWWVAEIYLTDDLNKKRITKTLRFNSKEGAKAVVDRINNDRNMMPHRLSFEDSDGRSLSIDPRDVFTVEAMPESETEAAKAQQANDA